MGFFISPRLSSPAFIDENPGRLAMREERGRKPSTCMLMYYIYLHKSILIIMHTLISVVQCPQLEGWDNVVRDLCTGKGDTSILTHL